VATSADVTISGGSSGDKFGISVSGAGDYDNSNYNDIVVGAPSYSSSTGRAYIFYGDGSIPTAAGSADYTYTGESTGDEFGFSVSNAGDVNNDNYDDVVIGAPANDDGGTDAGKAYVYSIDSTSFVSSNSRTYGYVADFANAQSASDSGASATLSEEDVSGSEYMYVDGLGSEKTGWTTGGSSPYLDTVEGTNKISTSTDNAEHGDFTFNDSTVSGIFSSSQVELYSEQAGTLETVEVFIHDGSSWTSAGTISPDSSYSWKSLSTSSILDTKTKIDAAKMYVKYSKSGKADAIQIDAARLYWTTTTLYMMDLEFNTTNVKSADSYTLQLNYSTSGTETAFGVLAYNTTASDWDDFTSQGDLSATSFTLKNYSLDSDHRYSSGYVRIRFIGRNETSDTTNSTLSIEFHRIACSNVSVKLTGAAAGDNFGWSGANVSDINEDGSYDDVIVGAPGYGENVGRAYIFHGGSIMDSTADLTMTGGSPEEKFGFSVHSGGDIGGDGVPDALVGAPYFDTDSLTDAGVVYVFYGGSSMDAAPDYKHFGDQASAHFGWSVSLAGNMNGDSYNELVGGAPDYDDGAKTDAGKAEVLYIFMIPEFSEVAIPIFTVIIAMFIRRSRGRRKTQAREPGKSPVERTLELTKE
jgi:hypothetical protein